jgi:hypothetical protein
MLIDLTQQMMYMHMEKTDLGFFPSLDVTHPLHPLYCTPLLRCRSGDPAFQEMGNYNARYELTPLSERDGTKG